MTNLSPYMTTVQTAATEKDMTTLADVKSELSIANGGSDEKLSRLIREASADCVRYVERVLAQETVTDFYRANRLLTDGLSGLRGRVEALQLSRWPVSTIGTVIEDGVTLAASGYELNADAGELWRLDGSDQRIGWARAKITVAYTGGYDMPDGLPEDLQRACIDMVKSLWFRQSRDPLVRQESVPGVLEQQFWVGAPGDNGALPPDVTARLDPYRWIPV